MLRHQQAALDHTVVQRPIGCGIDDAESIAKHADRPAAGIERRGMGDGIDPACHAADHDGALGHGGGKDACCFGSIRRVIAAPDERDGGPREQ